MFTVECATVECPPLGILSKLRLWESVMLGYLLILPVSLFPGGKGDDEVDRASVSIQVPMWRVYVRMNVSVLVCT